MNFLSWAKLEEYNSTSETPLYCNAHLSRMGLRPKDKNNFERHKVQSGGHWREYDFYTLDNTVETRKVNRTRSVLPETIDNLCEALYVINKSAKISRNTAISKYRSRDYARAGGAKTRKEKLYTLKDKTIRKLVDSGVLNLTGYHTQIMRRTDIVWHSARETCEHECEDCYSDDWGCDERRLCECKEHRPERIEVQETNYLLLYNHGNFSFHIPVPHKPENLCFLGEIEGAISHESKRPTSINFYDALHLLEKYVS